MEDAKQQAETSLSKFSTGLDQVEQTLRPMLKSLDELRASGNEEDLDSMSRARMHISLAYAVNTLFCMYLRTQGVDPATHPVSDEIGRVQDAFMRMRKVEAGLSVDHQRAPDRDRRKHYENMRRNSQKLAGLIFPEEVELLNAVRGKKRKREAEQREKEKMRKKGKKSESQSGGELSSSSDDGNDCHTKGAQGGASNLRHFLDSSKQQSERKKKKQKDERNAENTSAKKKRKKSNKAESADIDSDKKKVKDKGDKKSKKDKKNRTSTEKGGVSEQQPKASPPSDRKRKRKKT